jgi:hypothetical protein
MAHVGIPTLYAGALFRSQLEAHWAAYLDLLGWRWTYEPFDLLSAGSRPGHIPDFAIIFPHQTVMLSIKPYTREEEMRVFAEDELEPVNWAGEWMVGGAGGPWEEMRGSCILGLLSQAVYGPDGPARSWASGAVGVCGMGNPDNPHLSLQHVEQEFSCYVCGDYPGGTIHNLSREYLGSGIATAFALWQHAGNTVRWRARHPESADRKRLTGPTWDKSGWPHWDSLL